MVSADFGCDFDVCGDRDFLLGGEFARAVCECRGANRRVSALDDFGVFFQKDLDREEELD